MSPEKSWEHVVFFFGTCSAKSMGDGLFNVFDWKFSFSCFSKIESPGKPVAVNFHPLETPKKTSHFHSCLKKMVRIPRFFQVHQFFLAGFFRLAKTVFFSRPTSLRTCNSCKSAWRWPRDTPRRPGSGTYVATVFPLEKGKNILQH